MRLDVFLHIDQGHEVPTLLNAISRKLDLVITKETSIMATVVELNAAVARNTDAEQSVITLLNGISQQLKDAQGDPAAIDAVIAQIDANTAAAAAAVVANTPAPAA